MFLACSVVNAKGPCETIVVGFELYCRLRSNYHMHMSWSILVFNDYWLCLCVWFFFLFVYRHFPQYFSYIVAVNFIGEGNRSILGKSKACSSPNQYNPMVAIACTCTDIYVYSNVENKSRGRHMWEIIFI